MEEKGTEAFSFQQPYALEIALGNNTLEYR